MNKTEIKTKVGEVRPSQLMFTFGVGASIDLPHLSVMVLGLDDWNRNDLLGKEIGEERLLSAVRQVLGTQVQRLCAPPSVPDNGGPPSPFDENARVGVPVATFPRWVRCPYCQRLAPLGSGLFELKSDLFRPDKTRYVHSNCNKPGLKPPVLPARFLVACENGHLDDFPWVQYVHRGQSCGRPLLRLDEFGASGEAAAILVRCDSCKAARSMAEAFGEEGDLPITCTGRHPHLKTHESGCEAELRTILLGASNSWFPITMSTFSIPVASNELGQKVDEHWTVLKDVVHPAILPAFRNQGMLNAFAAFSDEEIWQAVESKRQAPLGEPSATDVTDLKRPEWEVLTNAVATQNSEDFRLSTVAPPVGYEAQFEQVVLVERMREVHALLGFTRIGSPGDFGEVAEIPVERRGRLMRAAPDYVPATEVRGEGLFLQFNEARLMAWCVENSVQGRGKEFFKAHRDWRQSRKIPNPDAGFPEMRFVLLHSFAHALMRQLCLECGYTAASIRERIYSRESVEEGGPMAGVLIYTAAPDSEGTLGGLVSLGQPKVLARHIEQALEQIRICASDPLCAEHHPHLEGVTLHGAACHACLFSPETSCERGNKYLDRAVLVPTFGSAITPFFG